MLQSAILFVIYKKEINQSEALKKSSKLLDNLEQNI